VNILAIDTAGAVLSTALAAGDQCWHFEVDAGLRHSELAMDSVDMLMEKAGLAREELSGVVCMGGPGSFTGLRIGFSLAKGLALALGIPFKSVPTLDCMAWPFSPWPGIVLPAIDAKKGAFFCALYSRGRRLGADMDAGPEHIARSLAAAGAGAENPVLVTGPDADRLIEALGGENAGNLTLGMGPMPAGGGARALLDIAKKNKIFDNGNSDWFSGPVYIRKSDAELSAKK
jgi:tRNA threonylcarbamoyladenosine biosynthesis protein TsaB